MIIKIMIKFKTMISEANLEKKCKRNESLSLIVVYLRKMGLEGKV